jgi:broad specificity phosphatase PhoE
MALTWLIRHGQSAANAGERTEAPDAIPLTRLGDAQALAVAEALERAPGLIAVSPYLRARRTAEPTQRRFPHVPVETWPVHEFSFLSPARCVNTTRVDRWPMVVDYWRRADPDHVDGEGAESYAAFAARARETLRRLADEKRTPVAVFAHEQLILRVIWEIVAAPAVADAADMRAFGRFQDTVQVDNAARLELERHGDSWLWRLSPAPRVPRK